MSEIELDRKSKYQESIEETTKNNINIIFDEIMNSAIKNNASDIHIEPRFEDFIIRFRINGKLSEVQKSDINTYNQLATIIKVKASMNIAEKRLPQDGSFDYEIDNQYIDVRVSSIPVIYGEKIVLRLLNRQNIFMDQSKLGFSNKDISRIDNIIKDKRGILLVTGPTGSGKTTTIYSILQRLINQNKNIITIEDPVEYKLQGINQIQVNDKVGLSFDIGLKSILRQDPDIIMVGEIRDIQTAKIAIRAASTGHMVISTMHTKDCLSAISRLIDMGIDDYMIKDCIIGIISQELISKECECIDTKERCNKCSKTGYIGRKLIYEILEPNENIINTNNIKQKMEKVI